ncbi:7,8-didemethyl-8-hydroxy-5-deazariboflavin synthase CofG [Cellulomonas soli]|uniref:7,8-didemethyl-8-hydroxy-5-deazariboflavin synthase CofG n=1 Tax=Cellulomonas soli TaxID=931535 RepID=UPI003F878F83
MHHHVTPDEPRRAAAPDEITAALTRAEALQTPSYADAVALLQATGPQLERLLAVASAVRDEGLHRRGRPGVITYSRKVFVPVTTLCRDRCHYCVFVDTPHQLTAQGKAPFLTPEDVLGIAHAGADLGCKEVLLTLGDRPEARWPLAADWLQAHGHDSTVDYLRHLAELIVTETGMLPHLNPGVLTWRELQLLRPVSASMGMMLETTATRLWAEPGGVHFGSPDKDPAVRLRAIADAGEAQVPFTSGLLLGLGESPADRATALFALRDLHDRYGHLQEVIVQNLRVKPATAMQNDHDLGLEEYLAGIAVARLVLGPMMTVQAPPNLSDPSDLGLLVRAGIDDWGGVSPLTPDHVNPERPWPHLDVLADLTARHGFTVTERLAAQPQYVLGRDVWIDPALHQAVDALAREDGLARDGRATPPAPPAGARTSGGLVRLAPPRLEPAVTDALRCAEQDPAGLSDEQYAALLGARGAGLEALAALADQVRADTVGDVLTFVANRNLDSALFRGPARPADAPWGTPPALDDDLLTTLVAEAWDRGATEICAQGAPGPQAGPHAYEDLVRVVHEAAPAMHLHAFRPAELLDGAARAGVGLAEHLAALREAGLASVPGTVARVLDDEVRARLSGGTDISVAQWEATIRAAHHAGLRSTSTIVYGHVETAPQVVAHLRLLRRIQQETGGFTEFIAMPYVSQGPDDPFGPGPDLATGAALHAVARLLLHGHVDHVQVAWTKLGLRGAARVLRSGADDAGGLLLGGGLEPFAGAEAGRDLGVADMSRLAGELGRAPRQRTTAYGVPDAERRTTLAEHHHPAGPLVRPTPRPATTRGGSA